MHNRLHKPMHFQKERVELFHLLLRKLPEDYARVIMLRNFQQLSFCEIGEQMERSEAAAGKLWDRAIAKFQHELNQANGQAEPGEE